MLRRNVSIPMFKKSVRNQSVFPLPPNLTQTSKAKTRTHHNPNAHTLPQPLHRSLPTYTFKIRPSVPVRPIPGNQFQIYIGRYRHVFRIYLEDLVTSFLSRWWHLFERRESWSNSSTYNTNSLLIKRQINIHIKSYQTVQASSTPHQSYPVGSWRPALASHTSLSKKPSLKTTQKIASNTNHNKHTPSSLNPIHLI